MSRFASFREFYPFYLSEHSNRTSRRLHFVGSCGVLVLLGMAIWSRTGWWLLAALLCGYGFAWVLREEPAGDVQASVLFVRGGLDDVQGHRDWTHQVLIPNPVIRLPWPPARHSCSRTTVGGADQVLRKSCRCSPWPAARADRAYG